MKKKKIIIAFTLFLVYLFLINVIANMNFNLNNILNSKVDNEDTGSLVEIGMDIKGTATLEGQRFYGKIYQQGETKKVILFNIIPLPLKNESFSYFYIIHILFILVFSTILLKGGFKNNERKQKDFDDVSNGDNGRGFSNSDIEHPNYSIKYTI